MPGVQINDPTLLIPPSSLGTRPWRADWARLLGGNGVAGADIAGCKGRTQSKGWKQGEICLKCQLRATPCPRHEIKPWTPPLGTIGIPMPVGYLKLPDPRCSANRWCDQNWTRVCRPLKATHWSQGWSTRVPGAILALFCKGVCGRPPGSFKKAKGILGLDRMGPQL
jgi:hypothetical protein